MKKKGVLLSAAVLLLSLFLGGCGTPMYELTDSEEEIIVHYAAYALAKHNTFQKDGMRVVPQELLEETEETEEPETQTDSETEDTESSQAPPQRIRRRRYGKSDLACGGGRICGYSGYYL